MSDQDQAACAHIKWHVRATDDWRRAFCPDCKQNIPFTRAINMELERTRKFIKETESELERLRLYKADKDY